MELYAKILNIAMPFFLLLILLEVMLERKLGKRVFRSMDAVSSISSGMTNVIKDVLGLTVSFFTYEWMLSHLAIFEVKTTWWVYLITFIVVDFKGYWTHRWEHKINFLWNRHVIHHSSEEFNLACALRQTISTIFDYFTFLLLPAAIIGIPVEVMVVVIPIHLFLQFWYHTQLVGKMGFLEKIIVTPSHHRVHHAVNKEYLDKNLGQIFIVWDKWFGTFQQELPEVPCVYGISRPARTWNPIKINFQHFGLLARDAFYTKCWRDKFRIWFMPTGWRPKDVEKRFPVNSIGNPTSYGKFDTPASPLLKKWSWVQLLFNYSLLIFLFAFIGNIGWWNALGYGLFIIFSVFAYTDLMDGNRSAFYLETFKGVAALTFIFLTGDWFGAKASLGNWAPILVASYQVMAIMMGAFFTFWEKFSPPTPSMAIVNQPGRPTHSRQDVFPSQF